MSKLTAQKIAGIEYIECGEGEPVIFLHGIGGGAASFNSQLAQIEGYRCIAWNMPGYESSDARTWPPSFETLSESLGDFISALQLNKAHLVGQSLGGMLTLEHALRHPAQVVSLTIIASTPSFGGADDSFKEAFLKARLASLDAGETMAQVAKQSASKLVGPAASKQCIADIELTLSRVSEKTWRGILECLVTFNRRNDLIKIDKPCCLIAGGHDQNAPAKTMQKASDKISKAEFHLIEDAGHMLNQEAPEKTNAIINRFLQKASF